MYPLLYGLFSINFFFSFWCVRVFWHQLLFCTLLWFWVRTSSNKGTTRSVFLISFFEVLKISALAIVPYLQKLINQTFTQSEFPDCLKIAKVIPLFKSGSETDVDNYGSISLLPVLNKILENIMYNRLTKFFYKNDILMRSNLVLDLSIQLEML